MNFSKLLGNEINIKIGEKELNLKIKIIKETEFIFSIDNPLQLDLIQKSINKGFNKISFILDKEKLNKYECDILSIKSNELICSIPTIFNFEQRRKDDRLPISLNASFFQIENSNVDIKDINIKKIIKENKKNILNEKTIDISKQGLKILSKKQFKENDILYINLSKLFLNIDFIGKIVRIAPKNNSFYLGIKIIDINEKNKKILNDFIDKRL